MIEWCSEKWLFNQLSSEQTIYCHTVWYISGERLKEKIEVDHSWEWKDSLTCSSWVANFNCFSVLFFRPVHPCYTACTCKWSNPLWSYTKWGVVSWIKINKKRTWQSQFPLAHFLCQYFGKAGTISVRQMPWTYPWSRTWSSRSNRHCRWMFLFVTWKSRFPAASAFCCPNCSWTRKGCSPFTG